MPARLARRLAVITVLITALGVPLVGCETPIDPWLAPTPPDYYGDVRPILVEKCAICHTPGGIGPFALTTYEQARERSESIVTQTRARIMPPFLADNSGACNTWSNHRGLSDEEIGVLDAWDLGGRLEGDPDTPAPPPVELPGLASVDLSIEMPRPYTIQEMVDGEPIDDDYRCFVVESGTTEDLFITGYEVHPGNAQRVHHVIVYTPESAGAEAQARALDTGSGYTCYGGAGISSSPLVLWAPGTGATMFPAGTGLLHPAGRALIIQIHYNNQVADSSNQDLTSIDLATSRTVARSATLALVGDFDLNLPPGRASVIESDSTSFAILPRDYEVWGVFPHMHELGQNMRLDVDRGRGADRCLIDVPRWDFNWQLAYWLDDPITVTSADSVSVSCDFNTMSRTEVTTYGEGTLDEMCLAFLYAAPAR